MHVAINLKKLPSFGVASKNCHTYLKRLLKVPLPLLTTCLCKLGFPYISTKYYTATDSRSRNENPSMKETKKKVYEM